MSDLQPSSRWATTWRLCVTTQAVKSPENLEWFLPALADFGWGRCGTRTGETRIRYTGKERDVESQYDYFGARYYDSRIGRWLAVDQHAEIYPFLALFTYCADNPVAFSDFNGKDIHEANSARQNEFFQSLKALFRSTSLGAAVWNRIESDHGILVSIAVANWPKDYGTRAFTLWHVGWQNLPTVPDQDGDIIEPNGRIVIQMDFNKAMFGKSRVDLVAAMFDELFSHIYFERYILKTGSLYSGFDRSELEDHITLGEVPNWPIRPGSPAEEIRDETSRIMEKKTKSGHGLRPKRATDSMRKPDFTDPISGKKYVVD